MFINLAHPLINSNKSTDTCKTLNIKVNKEPGLDC